MTNYQRIQGSSSTHLHYQPLREENLNSSLEHEHDDSIDKEIHSMNSEFQQRIEVLMNPNIAQHNFLYDLLDIYSFLQYYQKKLEIKKYSFQEIYIAFYYEGNKPLKLVNDMYQGLLIKLLNFYQHKSLKKEKCNGDQILIVNLLNQINFPKMLKDILLRVVWRKILIDVLQFFEEKLNHQPIVSQQLKEYSKQSFEQVACDVKMQTFRSLMNILILEKCLDFQQSEVSNLLKYLNQQKVTLAKQKQDLQVKQKNMEIGILKSEKGSRKEMQFLSLLNKTKDEIQKIEIKQEKLERQIYFSCKPMECLGIDNKKNVYWLFEEEKYSLFIIDKNDRWQIVRGQFSKIIDDLQDQCENEANLKYLLQNALKRNILVPTTNENIQCNLELIRIETQKKLHQYLKEQPFNNIDQQIHYHKSEKSAFEYLYKDLLTLTIQFFKDFILKIEEDYSTYLLMFSCYWILPENKQENFKNILDEIKDYDQMKIFLLKLNKQFKTVFKKESQQEEEIHIDLNNIDERQERTNLKKIGDIQKLPKKNKFKEIKVLFWHFYVKKIRSKFDELVSQKLDKETLFVTFCIFVTILYQFMAKKMKRENKISFVDKKERKFKKLIQHEINLIPRKQLFLEQCNLCLLKGEKLATCCKCKKKYHSECLVFFSKCQRKKICKKCKKALNIKQLQLL